MFKMLSPTRLSPVSTSDVDGSQQAPSDPLAVADADDDDSTSKPALVVSSEENDDEEEDWTRPMNLGVSLAQKIQDEFLLCKICLENYKRPKSLECMHTFCEECIESHVFSESSYKKYSDYREFQCPLCRKRSQMPFGGVRKLPDNLLVKGLMSAVAKCRPLSPFHAADTCDICQAPLSTRIQPTSGPSPARCLDCDKSMCSTCVSTHMTTPVTRHHSIYDPDAVSGVLQDPDALGCREHIDETVKYFCVDCERCVCVLCALDTTPGQPHGDHEIVDFNVAVSRYETPLKELCDQAANDSARLEADLNTLASCADTVEAVRQRIRSTAEEFRRQIDKEEKTLLDRLGSLFDPDCQRLIESRPTLRERSDRLLALRRRAEAVIERRGMELLLMRQEIKEQFEKEQKRQEEGPVQPLPDAVKRRVAFEPGLVKLGDLCETAGDMKSVIGGGTVKSCQGKDSSGQWKKIVAECNVGCPCQCHLAGGVVDIGRRASAPAVEESTMTESVKQLDKAVNTRARGLLHSGGSGKRSGHRGSAPADAQSPLTEQLEETQRK